MKRGWALVGVMTCLAAAGCGQPAGGSKATSPQSSPEQATALATIQDIMLSMADPAADTLWDSVKTISDATGVHDYKPETPEEWEKLRHAALILVETPNLLTMPGREVVAAGKSIEEGGSLDAAAIKAKIDSERENFALAALGLQKAGLQTLAAIQARDVDKLQEAGAVIDEACEACHTQYWYPPEPGSNTQGGY